MKRKSKASVWRGTIGTTVQLKSFKKDYIAAMLRLVPKMIKKPTDNFKLVTVIEVGCGRLSFPSYYCLLHTGR